MSPRGISMAMDLHPTLDAILDDFIQEELDRLIHQGAKLEASLYLHQARMEEVCHSIKSHNHWVHYREYFPFTNHCRFCGVDVSPEFDMRRHRGLCILLTYNGTIPLTGLFLEFPAIIRALRHRGRYG